LPVEKYADIFTGKVGLIKNTPGRGFANVTVKPEGVTGTFRMNLPYEVQCALPYRTEDAEESGDTKKVFTKNSDRNLVFRRQVPEMCKKYWTFPKELTWEEYEKLKQQPKNEQKEYRLPVSVGLDYVNFYPVTVDLEQSRVIAIYGKKGFGKNQLALSAA